MSLWKTQMSSLSKTWITNTVHFPSSSDMTYEGQGGNSTITTTDFDSFKQLQAPKVWEFVAWTTNSIVIIKLCCIYLKGCFNNGLIVDISETAPNSNRQTFFVSLTGPTTFNNSKWQRDPTRSIVLPPASVGFTHVSPDPRLSHLITLVLCTKGKEEKVGFFDCRCPRTAWKPQPSQLRSADTSGSAQNTSQSTASTATPCSSCV